MSPLGSIYNSLGSTVNPVTVPVKLPNTQEIGTAGNSKAAGFGSTLENLVNTVSGKEAQAEAITNNVITGQSGQLHQSVIAMQEASVALSLMVQVRNKLVDSYQELMRMQV
jgi:flagellar hook-basal body complex protein FliE